LIIGEEGDYTKKDIKNMILHLNLTDSVKYLGPKYGKEKNTIIGNSDILLYPSLNDAFPLVLIEFMRDGHPIIATREGAISEIIEDGTTGFLVDKSKPYQLAEKVEILFNDRALLKKMGQAARSKYEQKYTLNIFELNIKDTFEKIIKMKTHETTYSES
jgi:glycosyltransferase involved in cell wall biosynthesis